MTANIHAAVLGCSLVLLANHARADDGRTKPVADYVRSHVMPWINDPVIIDAVKAQNAQHVAITPDQIANLDRKWTAEVQSADKPFIESVLNNAASKFLQEKQAASHGVIAEIFVMDDKGLNVAQSDATSDYWQGDEEKFQRSFGAGPDALFVAAPEKDDSTRRFESQASFTLKDETGKAVGAVTVGISLDNL